jgi:hypothetical protein
MIGYVSVRRNQPSGTQPSYIQLKTLGYLGVSIAATLTGCGAIVSGFDLVYLGRVPEYTETPGRRRDGESTGMSALIRV